jgi:hypothetical protein
LNLMQRTRENESVAFLKKKTESFVLSNFVQAP